MTAGRVACIVAVALGIAFACGDRRAAGQTPPFSGTAFIDPDIILSSDWSTFQTLSYVGIQNRQVFDRRTNAWAVVPMHLFNADFADALRAEVQVNLEFGGSVAAKTLARTYAQVIGRLPTSLRADVQTVTIHDGVQSFGGGNNNILIHVGQALQYGAYLEEILFHEATHTSFDADHAQAASWLAAQQADGNFISTYARDNPTSEDVAESLLPWFAARHRSTRISSAVRNTIRQTILHRLAYFDALAIVISDPLLTGDFNGDGAVDAADYVVWRRTRGTNFHLRGNGDETGASGGIVDGEDYALWGANFGRTAGSQRAAALSVPEPVSTVSILIAALVWSIALHGRIAPMHG